MDLPEQRKTVKIFKKGDMIAREGDHDHGWFILVSGQVGVFKQKLLLTTIETPGMIFGELSGILNRPRTASLMATEECKVIYITATIDELIHHFPDIAKKVLVNTAERLATTTEELWMAIQEKKQS